MPLKSICERKHCFFMKPHTDLFNYSLLSASDLASFEENGYLIIKKVLSDRGLQLMRDECMQAWNAEKESFDPSKTWLQNSLLVNIHHAARSVRDYYFEGPL